MMQMMENLYKPFIQGDSLYVLAGAGLDHPQRGNLIKNNYDQPFFIFMDFEYNESDTLLA